MEAFKKRTNFSAIQNAAGKSGLSAAQQQEILALFNNAEDSDLLEIADLCKEDPLNLAILYRNFASKRDAIQNGDEAQWEAAVDDEIAFLESEDSPKL